MSLPFRELFTVTAVVDKYENAPFEQRRQAIEEKPSETEWTYEARKACFIQKNMTILAENVSFKTENCQWFCPS